MRGHVLHRIAAILFLGGLCNVYMAAAPSFVGALVDYQGFSEAFAGRLISYSNIGATLASLLAILVIHRGGWDLRRTIAGCMLILIVTSLGAATLSPWPWLLSVNWFVNGIAAGLSFTVCAVALMTMPWMERTYAVLCGTPFVLGGAALSGLPALYRSIGLEGVFGGIALLALVALPMHRLFPIGVGRCNTASASTRDQFPARAIPVTAIMVALFLFNAANTGVWVYLERIGVSLGLSPEDSGAILGPGLAAALIGMCGAGILGDRLGHVIPIIAGLIAITLATGALAAFTSPLVFGLASGVFNASITFVVPYFVAFAALLAPSGRAVAAANFLLMAGYSLGALVASYLLHGDSFSRLYFTSIAGFAIALALTALVKRNDINRLDDDSRAKIAT
jgi:predicted MFS family arabinose efflux permease